MIAINDIDFFIKINNAYGAKSQKDTTLYEIRNAINQTYMETIDYQPDTLVDGKLMPLIVMESRGGGADREQYKKIEAPPQSHFDLGSKVDCFGLKWLVTEVNYNQELKLAGKMKLCNYVLKWQDKNGDIIEEECVVSRYKTSATGEDVGKVITVDDTRRSIFIQFNPRTASLKQGMRFFIDFEGLENVKPYRLTDLNRTTYIYNKRGFFDLVCTEDQVRDTDKPDLMLCDYRETPLPFVPSIGSCKIVYNGEPTIKCGGSDKTFAAVFYDNDGKLITTLQPTWELIQPPGLLILNQLVILSEIGNEIRLSCKSGDDAIGMTFLLKLVTEDIDYGYFECIQEISIVELF